MNLQQTRLHSHWKTTILILVCLLLFTLVQAIDYRNVLPIGQDGRVFYCSANRGNYVFTGTEDGMTVFDVTTPSSPVLKTKLTLPMAAANIQVYGDYLLTAVTNAGLCVVNAKNPLQPYQQGWWVPPDAFEYIHKITYKGNLAYVIGYQHMYIINISNPATPIMVGSIGFTDYSNLNGIGVNSTYAYVCNENGLVRVIDVSNPTSPSEVGSVQIDGGAYDMVFNGNYAYLSGEGTGLTVLSLSNATAPQFVKSLDTPSMSRELDYQNNRVYLADVFGGLLIYDVTTASNPVIRGNYLAPGGAFGMSINSTYAFICDIVGLSVVNFTNPTNPTLTGEYSVPLGMALGVAAKGKYAYVTEAMGLRVVDVSVPSKTTTMGRCSMKVTEGIALQGNYAYIGCEFNGLSIVNISNPSVPSIVTTLGGFNAINVAVQSTFVFTAGDDDGFRIFNVTNPSIPVTLGSLVYGSETSITDVAVKGNYAYLASDQRVFVVDISNLSNPHIVHTVNLTGWVNGIKVKGNYVYAASWDQGVNIIDITNPLSAYVIGSVLTPGAASYLDVNDRYAFVGCVYGGVAVIKIVDPANPTLVGYFDTPGEAQRVSVSGDTVYVADSFSGLRILLYKRGEPSELPSLKLFNGFGNVSSFRMSEYYPNFHTNNPSSYSYGIATNFMNLSSLISLGSFTSDFGDMFSQGSYGSATSGTNTLYYQIGTDTVYASNKVKFSTYKMKKLPLIGLRPSQTYTLYLNQYCTNSAGAALAPSFGNASAVIVSDAAAITATWSGNSILYLYALSGLTSSSKVSVDIIASPSAAAPFSSNQDKERLWIYPNLLKTGTFSSATDTTSFGYQSVADRNAFPNMYYVAGRLDNGGNYESGILAFGFSSTNQGLKITPKSGNFIPFEKNQWYIARIKLFSNAAANDIQAQIYNYKGVIPEDSQINCAANIIFGVPTTWTWLEASLYTTETGLGYPQLFFKSGSTNGGLGNLYVDELQVIQGTPLLMDANRSSKHANFSKGKFTNLTDFALGWSTTQTYLGSSAVPAMVINNGELDLVFSGASSGNNQIGAKYTARSQDSAYVVYTPANKSGYGVGMQLDIAKFAGAFTGYESILYMACYGVPNYGDGNIVHSKTQIIASGEFGGIADGRHFLTAIGRNPYHQIQFAVKSATPGILGVMNVDFIRDMDDPNFGDPSLY